uniref:Calmodulin n=1 Tax=Angiostrongylus cantonensis TaxID=6313 RepID=A0A0K0D4B0_ANGCA
LGLCSAGEVGEIRDDDLKGIFREFDLNGDGFIQRDELRSVMQKMGQSPTEEELDAMFNAADQDNDGNIDFKESFFSVMKKNAFIQQIKATLRVRNVLNIFRSELRTAFQRMGHSLSDQDIKAIYKHVDANNDGKINFQVEFCRFSHCGT